MQHAKFIICPGCLGREVAAKGVVRHPYVDSVVMCTACLNECLDEIKAAYRHKRDTDVAIDFEIENRLTDFDRDPLVNVVMSERLSFSERLSLALELTEQGCPTDALIERLGATIKLTRHAA